MGRQLTVITRPKPNFKKVEKSSVLGKVKAFMPTIQKAEVDLWKEMKLKGEKAVDAEDLSREFDDSSDDSSEDSDAMNDEEQRIFDLINLKLGRAKIKTEENSSSESGFSSHMIQPMDEE